MELIWFILIGIVAGWIASKLMKSGDFGLVGYLVVGVVGAVVGGFVLGLIGLAPVSLLGRLITATIGAMVFISLLRFVRRKVR
jgi:uncharacterized membrane protein YeaQ/YmgE (transglycosylase-associated protein family)